MDERTTFVFCSKWYDAFKDFEPKIQLEIYNAIIIYATKNIEIDLSPIAKMAFNFIKKDIDSNAGKYDAICVRNQTNGKKGGRPKKNREKPKKPTGFLDNPNNPNGFSDNPKKANGFSENQMVFLEEREKEEKERSKEKEVKDKEDIYIPPIIPQRDEKENKIFKLDITSPKIQNEEKEKSCAKKEKIAFDVFWDLYDKKVGDKERLKKKWDNLSLNIQNQILDYIPKYIESQPDKKYRKNPETFFNQKSWEDEIINQNQNQVYKTNQMVYAEF